MIGRFFGKTGRGLAIAAAIFAAVGLTTAPRPAHAVSPGAAVGIGLGAFALGSALANPYYNVEGIGIRFVASPRHADMLLVTGPVSKHMAIALKRTYDATPDPKLVVAVGDCGCTGGIFGADRGRGGVVEIYGVHGWER